MSKFESTVNSILEFWFGSDPIGEPLDRASKWFVKDSAFDLSIAEQFKGLLAEVHNGSLDNWRKTPEGTMALIILTDQFPRNIFRNQKTAFSFDPIALATAKEGVQKGVDQKLSWVQRAFFYLPFEHSENLQDQEQSVSLFEKLTQTIPPKYNDFGAETYEYALRHWEIIKRFGRFPHRNAILKRVSTPEEMEFLKQPNSSF